MCVSETPIVTAINGLRSFSILARRTHINTHTHTHLFHFGAENLDAPLGQIVCVLRRILVYMRCTWWYIYVTREHAFTPHSQIHTLHITCTNSYTQINTTQIQLFTTTRSYTYTYATQMQHTYNHSHQITHAQSHNTHAIMYTNSHKQIQHTYIHIHINKYNTHTIISTSSHTHVHIQHTYNHSHQQSGCKCGG